MSDICQYAEACPIFSGVLQGKEVTTKSYKLQFCEAGIEGRNKCKRFQCKEKYGKVPEDLLPNSYKSIEDIGKEIFGNKYM